VIALTSRAADEIQKAQSDKGIEGYALRVQVVGGGCEGFLYDLLYVDCPDPEDHVFESNGVRIAVNPRALGAVQGLTIDHAGTRYGPGFVFTNPRAKGKCSCGASFST
jgi:iron-sulfur cluster assembly accessory protein